MQFSQEQKKTSFINITALLLAQKQAEQLQLANANIPEEYGMRSNNNTFELTVIRRAYSTKENTIKSLLMLLDEYLKDNYQMVENAIERVVSKDY